MYFECFMFVFLLLKFCKNINLYESLFVLKTIFLSFHVRLITLPLR